MSAFAPSDSLKQEKTLSKRYVHHGKVINLRVDEALNAHEQPVIREVVEHPGGVCVLPVLPDGRLVFVQQYRYPTGEYLLEFPAGKLDVKGEPPADAIKRELAEETGYKAKTWRELGYIYTAPGFCDERIWLYIATDLEALPEGQTLDADEAIDPILLTSEQIKEALRKQQIRDGKTLSLLTHYWLSQNF